MPDIQDPTKIRNIASSNETPTIVGFSSRRQNGIYFVGLLFLPRGKA